MTTIFRVARMLKAMGMHRLLTRNQINFEVSLILGRPFDIYLVTDDEFEQALSDYKHRKLIECPECHTIVQVEVGQACPICSKVRI